MPPAEPAVAIATDPLTQGPLIGPAKVARLTAIDGQEASAPTVWRWMVKGVQIRGQRVRLRSCRVGRRFATTEAAVKQFLAELADANDAESPSTPPQKTKPKRQERAESARERAARQAGEALTEAGI